LAIIYYILGDIVNRYPNHTLAYQHG
jgi:hypothetical protein